MRNPKQTTSPPSDLPSGKDEAALIDDARRGDRAAFGELVRMHQRAVFAFVASSVRDPDTVNDLAQETFLNAFRSLAGFRGESAFRTWLFGIARNRVLMHLRTELRRTSKEHGPIDVILLRKRLEALTTEPPNDVDRSSEIAALQDCIQTLGGGSERLVREHYFGGRPLGQIASETGQSQGAVRVAMFRVRQALRRCVEERMRAPS